MNEVVVELSKVSWPLGKETLASSGVVVVLVGIAALILAVVDMIWTKMAIKVFKI
ncbi:MAG: preprotein translocase subunit SecE [Deltaproteobacteria bacterium]|nr:preprotein translocase subunit SecE [Deltaproteobacteria bacterium]